jgi:hypothetical protein
MSNNHGIYRPFEGLRDEDWIDDAILARHLIRPEVDAGILPLWPIWRARGDSRMPAAPDQGRVPDRCAEQNDPGHLTPIGTFRISIKHAEIGDDMLLVIDSES